MSDNPLLSAALAALSVPRTATDLVRSLGLNPDSASAEAVLDDLAAGGRITFLGDGRVASGEKLLDGMVLWHRVDAVEVAVRRVSLGIDVMPALGVVPCPEEMLIGDGSVPVIEWLGIGDPDIERGPTVCLPDGWAPTLAAGELVAVVLDGLHLRLLSHDDPRLICDGGAIEVDALASVLAELASNHGDRLSVLEDSGQLSADAWVVDLESRGGALVADHGAALQRLDRLPLREAIVRAGCSSRGCLVAGPAVSAERLEAFTVGWMAARGFPVDEAPVLEACGALIGVLSGPRTRPSDGASTDRRTAADALKYLLRDPLVSQIIVDYLRRVDLGVVSEAERRLRPVQMARPHEPGLAWVRAAALLRQGRGHDALEILNVAVVRLDDRAFGDWPLLIRCAGRLRAIGGDLTSAAALLRRAHWVEDADELMRWQPKPPKVRRNDQCPCGSARKAKSCCLADPAPLPLGERVDLVWHNLAGWAVTQTFATSSMVLFGLSGAKAAALPKERVMAALDVNLFERGGLASALDEVGMLMPDDEYEVAMRWRMVRHGLWVVETTEGGAPVWSNVMTDARARVVGTLDVTKQVPVAPPGTHFLAPLLPGPAGHLLPRSAVRVPRDEVVPTMDVLSLGRDIPLLATLWRLKAGGSDTSTEAA